MQKTSLLSLTLVVAGMGPLWGQPPSGPAPVIPPVLSVEQAEKKTLDQLLTAALRHSPDIQLADAKLREAEAELRKTRSAVVQRVIELHGALESQQHKVATAEAVAQRMIQLAKSGGVSHEELAKAKADLEAARLTLNQVQLAMQGMTGKLWTGEAAGPAGLAPSGAPGAGQLINSPAATSAVGTTDAAGAGAGAAEPSQPPRGPMADRVRKALDASIRLDGFTNVPLRDVVTMLKGHTPGVPYLTNLGQKKDEPVTLELKGEIQIGALFQALQDVVPGLQVYVRDYGILLTMDESGVPTGGMWLMDFWRRAQIGKPN